MMHSTHFIYSYVVSLIKEFISVLIDFNNCYCYFVVLMLKQPFLIHPLFYQCAIYPHCLTIEAFTEDSFLTSIIGLFHVLFVCFPV